MAITYNWKIKKLERINTQEPWPVVENMVRAIHWEKHGEENGYTGRCSGILHLGRDEINIDNYSTEITKELLVQWVVSHLNEEKINASIRRQIESKLHPSITYEYE
jgi:hypothetical protein